MLNGLKFETILGPMLTPLYKTRQLILKLGVKYANADCSNVMVLVMFYITLENVSIDLPPQN
jgi:hypothetical protein